MTPEQKRRRARDLRRMAEQIAHESLQWVALDLARQLEAEAEAAERGEARPSDENNG